MAEIAVLGYGTIGSGVAEVLEKNRETIERKAGQPVRLKYLLDVRDFPSDPRRRMLVKDFDRILEDGNVSVVVECIGGIEPAYTYLKRALGRGKSVVTSNKELVARHGTELFTIARENNLNFLFEASVGGGIPIIKPLNLCLTSDDITEITGILNGTTNYILTEMTREALTEGRASFQRILRTAQENGYAEYNPAADIEGHDAARKLAILLSLAMERRVDYEHIHTEGILGITCADILFADRLDRVIKLLAAAKIDHGKREVSAMVAPVLVRKNHPLASVSDVFNAVFLKGWAIGELMFYGRGAGKLPTAGAVAADVVDAVRNPRGNGLRLWSAEPAEVTGAMSAPRMVRLRYDESVTPDIAQARAREIFGSAECVTCGRAPGELAVVTLPITDAELDDMCGRLGANLRAESRIRLL